MNDKMFDLLEQEDAKDALTDESIRSKLQYFMDCLDTIITELNEAQEILTRVEDTQLSLK